MPAKKKPTTFMDRVCVLLVIGLIDAGLWMWWRSTDGIFSQSLSSVSLGDLIYGLASRAVVLSGAIGSVAIALLIAKIE